MKLPLNEPLSARYLYVSPENIVHIFMPIVSGTTIGLDNTCKAVYALQEFFNKGSASDKTTGLKTELLAYKEALVSDISFLGSQSPLALQKQERLRQIDAYLQVLAAVAVHQELDCLALPFPSYPIPLENIMQDRDTSNLYSMVLHPEEQDDYLRSESVNPIFRVAHTSNMLQIESDESMLQQALITAYSTLTYCDLKATIMNQVLTRLKSVAGPFHLDTLQTLLHETVQTELGVVIDFGKNSKGVLITRSYIDELMLFDNETEPEQYIDALLGICAPDLFTTLHLSPFKYLTQAEQWSIATQFLLGLANIYAVTKGKTGQDSNWGAILDKRIDLSTTLAHTLAQAQRHNASIEDACLLWINQHATELQLLFPFNAEDIKTLKHDFAQRYIQIKDAPHFDEFFILDADKNGAFVMHQGSICTSFAIFVRSPLLAIPPELLQPLENALQQAPYLNGAIPHKNTLVQSEVEINTKTLDKVALQALHEHIDRYEDAVLKEQLAAQIKTERPDFKPQLDAKPFLQHVAYGQQQEAENLLKKDALRTQAYLTACDIEFTDYSGRTFTCTAYEYTWWAKDSHMRFMLERYMDDDTKQELLKRVQQIEELISGATLFQEPRGLVYTQRGKKCRSAHFDLMPLKTALKTYIEAYNQNPKSTDADWETLDALWVKVGLPQREVPAHIAQEYCNTKASFEELIAESSLLDAANPRNLKRKLNFFNVNKDSDDNWFNSVVSDEDSGLGYTFAVRGSTVWKLTTGLSYPRDAFASLDLSAIEAIDEARTKDLQRSLVRLMESASSQTPNLQGS